MKERDNSVGMNSGHSLLNGEKDRDSRLHDLQHAIDHSAHLLPAQGPITVFIHHNTLHAFEDLPFAEAVKVGGRAFGCQPYLSEDRYREELKRGRIRFSDLMAELEEDLKDGATERILTFGTRLELRSAMLEYPLRFGPTKELLWLMAETDALRRVRDDASAAVRARLIAETRRWAMRDLRRENEAARKGSSQRAVLSDRPTLTSLFERLNESKIEAWSDATWEAFTLQAMWHACVDGVARVAPIAPPPPMPSRHRDLLLEASGVDADLLVNDVLIRFCAAFLDQGLARWQLPRRDEGFLKAFCSLYGNTNVTPERWMRDLATELNRWKIENITPLEAIHASLEILGVPAEEWESWLSNTLLSLRGWGGIMRFLEERPDRAVHPIPTGSLTEFLAVRLLLDRIALTHTAKESFGYEGTLARLRDDLRMRVGSPPAATVEQRAFLVFQIAQVLGCTPEELHRLSELDWSLVVGEIETFSSVERRRIFHLAYERRFNIRTLDAISLHAASPVEIAPSRPRFQAMFCIDEREESIRRHVEEVIPDAVTYGIAGFYFIPMYYRGVEDAHFVPLCPAIMLPKHWVVERVVESLEEDHRRRARTRRTLGKASHTIHIGSRTLTMGAVLAATFGVLTTIPLVARVFFPRLASRIRKAFGRIVSAGSLTQLQLERSETTPGSENGAVGYTLDELTNFGERVLRDTGLTSGFSRLVFTFGHGSTSMNNPHESAHDCGACGGARGGPNGRAMAQILNDPRIRERLVARGLSMPADTIFVGGMHNTSSEEITFYDVGRIPDTHHAEFETARQLIEQAGNRDAHERVRRFESVPLTGTFVGARQHVEGRAEDLSQVRPEWGHATNAITIVARRNRTRGLYLDRRAFLNSYDPTQDDAEASILTRILQAAVPVCSGISLEYYFSYVDNSGYGCGTKLPHNITSLLGVMDGAASDLRTGLPWQMVEIHEPVRQLFVIESTPEIVLRIMDRNPSIGRLIRNGWVYLAVLDPNSAHIQFYKDGVFQEYKPEAARLPRAASSVDWYRGWRDHLEFAEIGGS